MKRILITALAGVLILTSWPGRIAAMEQGNTERERNSLWKAIARYLVREGYLFSFHVSEKRVRKAFRAKLEADAFGNHTREM